MSFIKYSVVQLGVDETVPGWVKQATEAAGVKPESAEPDVPANIIAEEKKEEGAEKPQN